MRKIWIYLNTVLDQTIKRGQILRKSVFLLKVSHIQINYAFFFVFKHFGENHRKVLFFCPKSDISEKCRETLRKFVFLNKFEKGQILRKIWICFKQIFWIKSVK